MSIVFILYNINSMYIILIVVVILLPIHIKQLLDGNVTLASLGSLLQIIAIACLIMHMHYLLLASHVNLAIKKANMIMFVLNLQKLVI